MPVPASTPPPTPGSQTAVVQGSNAAAAPTEGPVETTIHNRPTHTTTVHGSLVVPTPMQATLPAEVPVAEGTNPFPNAAQQGTGNINTVPAEVADLPPDNAAAGPSNWQSMAGMPAPPASKIEPDILIARFHRIIIDPPSPSDVISCYDKMKTCSATELDRKWYSVKEPYLPEMNGHSVQKNFGLGRGLRINGMSAAVRALNAKEDKLYPNRTRRHRKIMSPCFADEIMYNSKAPHYERFSWMFNASKLTYNLQECKKFMVIGIVENSWCLYEIDIEAKTTYVMDPTMTMSRRDTMEKKHQKTSKLMLHWLCICLHEWCPDWFFSTFPWTYKYNYGMHNSCSSADNRFYVPHYVREFDGLVLHTVPTPYLISYLRKEMMYEVLRMKGNKADFPNYLYGGILE